MRLARTDKLSKTFMVGMSDGPLLVQTRLFETREFALREHDIHLVVKDADGLFEIDIPLENITDTKRRRVQAQGRLLNIAISFAVFAAASMTLGFFGFDSLRRLFPIWALGAVICIVWYYASRKEYLLLETEGSGSIFFMSGRPSRQQVADFVVRVVRARNELLRRKYAKIFPENSLEDELERLQGLFQRGIITREELEQLQAQLMLRSRRTEGSHFVN